MYGTIKELNSNELGHLQHKLWRLSKLATKTGNKHPLIFIAHVQKMDNSLIWARNKSLIYKHMHNNYCSTSKCC